jgi:hypothetical protein
MKITKTKLKTIITEEMQKLKELGPETGHEEGTSADEIVTKIVADLAEVANHMSKQPSTVTASEFAGYFQSLSEELAVAMEELRAGGGERTPRGGDQVTEGDEQSRTISRIEDIGDVVLEVAGMIENPEAVERLERVDEMITALLQQMQGVEAAAGADAGGYSKVAGTRPMQEADEGGKGVHDIFNLPPDEPVEASGNPKEDAIRQVVASSSMGKVDGVKLDLYSASAIVQILDALSPQNKEKYLQEPVARMVQIAFKMAR